MANVSAKAIVTDWLRGKATPPAAHADTVPPTESDKGSLSNVMELIASFPTDSNYLTDMNMNFFSVVIGLALCLFLYLLIELIRLVRLYHYQRHLHDHRTPLSAGFDREKWGRFMLGALQRTEKEHGGGQRAQKAREGEEEGGEGRQEVERGADGIAAKAEPGLYGRQSSGAEERECNGRIWRR